MAEEGVHLLVEDLLRCARHQQGDGGTQRALLVGHRRDPADLGPHSVEGALVGHGLGIDELEPLGGRCQLLEDLVVLLAEPVSPVFVLFKVPRWKVASWFNPSYVYNSPNAVLTVSFRQSTLESRS